MADPHSFGFNDARQVLLGRKPPTTSLVDVMPWLDFPDEFLLELGRLITRFSRLKHAVVRTLDRSTDGAGSASETAALRVERLRDVLQRLSRSTAAGADQPGDLCPSAFMDTFNALAVVVAEYTSREWAPSSFMGARLENWPPINLGAADPKASSSTPARHGDAANDSSFPRQEPGTRVSAAEIRHLSDTCAHLYHELWQVTRKEPMEYRVSALPPGPR